MASQLKSLLERWEIDELLAYSTEGVDSNVSVVNMLGRNADIDTSAEDLHNAGGNYAFPTAARIHTLVSGSVQDQDNSVKAEADIVIADKTKIAAVAAVASITYGAPVALDTVVVNGHTFTKVTTITANDQYTTIAQLNILINALPEVNSTSDGTTISIVAAAVGTAGNAFTLTLGGGNSGTMAVSGGTFSGGTNQATLTINGVAFVGGTHFAIAASNALTAAALSAAINASTNPLIAGIVTASVVSATVTVKAVTGGTAGNSIALVTSNTAAATVESATLTGGLAATHTGAFIVRVKGLDASYLEVTEDVTLNGTSGVAMTHSLLRVNSMVVLTAGSGGAAAGAITATAATDTTVSAQIAASAVQWYGAIYTVPAGKTAFAFSMYSETPTATMVATTVLQVRPLNGVFTELIRQCVSSALPFWRDVFKSPFVIAEKSDIKLRTNTSADNADVTGGLTLLVVNN